MGEWTFGISPSGSLWDCFTWDAEDVARFEAGKEEASKKIEQFRQALMLSKKGEKIKRTAAQRKGWRR